MKNIKFCLLFFIIFLTACSSNNSNSTNKLEDNNKSSQASTKDYGDTSQSNNSNSTSQLEDNSNKSNQDSTKKYSDTSQEKQFSSNDSIKDKDKGKVNSEQNITEKIKNYIINGQENKPEAQKIKWSKTFLNKADIVSLYKQYIANGGRADDLESFANYMTINAPITSDWEALFKKDLYDTYREKVVRLEHLKDDLYQAYIVKDSSEIPYVVVSSRTGYFHG